MWIHEPRRVLLHAARWPVSWAVVRQRGTSRGVEREDPTLPGRECPELQSGQQVRPLKVGIVGDDVVDRHPGGEQFEQSFDRIPQSANDRLTMTNRQV